MRMTMLAILGGSCLLAMGPFVPRGRALAEDDSRSAGAVRPWPRAPTASGASGFVVPCIAERIGAIA